MKFGSQKADMLDNNTYGTFYPGILMGNLFKAKFQSSILYEA